MADGVTTSDTPDEAIARWVASDAALQRFLAQTASRAAAWAEPSELVELDELPPASRSGLLELCARYRRETHALARHGAPPEGFRSARMALWLGAGRLLGEVDASQAMGSRFASLVEHALAHVVREWRAFGDYEVSSLVDVRFPQFRLERACRYHYWRARLGTFALAWTGSARPEAVRRLRRGYDARIEAQDGGLAGVFTEWLDEERTLRERALELDRPFRAEDEASGLVAHLVFQEVRWRSLEAELERRALWHASQRERRDSILAELRLGEIGSYDPEFAGEDRALQVLSKLGRLASFSDVGHCSLGTATGGLATGAAEA